MAIYERSRLAHLFRRAGFGARPDELDDAEAAGYAATVERLVDLTSSDVAAEAVPRPTFTPFPPPPDVNFAEFTRMLVWWLDRMVVASRPLRERLTLFWHGHFATSVVKVTPLELMFRQNELLRSAGAGSFAALTQAVTRDPAMLLWLDSDSNRRESPNENLARELFELFALGIGNYGEDDVRAAARAFTGWRLDQPGWRLVADAAQHDDGAKSVLGQTGPWTGDDVARLACSSPACARFVVSRVWGHFARPVTPDDAVVADLAPGFAADLDVARLLRAVFLHPEFQAPATRTGLVKQPAEYVAGALRALGLRAGDLSQPVHQLAALGQLPFVPPDVAGWPQNGYWLSTSFGLARLRLASELAAKADLSSLAGTTPVGRPAAVARTLSVDRWGDRTAAALAGAARDPLALVTLALVSPEYVLA
jgi:uncharacterized protein (DUF1800 family)